MSVFQMSLKIRNVLYSVNKLNIDFVTIEDVDVIRNVKVTRTVTLRTGPNEVPASTELGQVSIFRSSFVYFIQVLMRVIFVTTTTAYNGRTSQTNKCKPTGDEHWTKVLQANDFCFTSCPRHCSSLVSSPRSATDREFGSIFLSFSHSTVAHSNSSSVSRASSFASRQKSPQSLSPQSPIAPNGVKEQFQVNSKEKNVFHSLYSRFINWIESNKVDSSKQLGGKTASVDQAKISCNDVASGRLNSSPSVGCGFPSEESIRLERIGFDLLAFENRISFRSISFNS